MSPAPLRSPLLRFAFVVLLVVAATPGLRPVAQSRAQSAKPQKLDEEYTAKIKEYLQDPRITHRAGRSPAGVGHGADAAQVPRPHRRHARRADLREGHPALLRGARQGVGPRSRSGRSARPKKAATWSLLAVADEATIKQLDKYKGMLASLTDPRKTTEEQAQQLIKHGQADLLDHERHALAETGGPEMLMELAVPAGGRRDAVHPGRSATT